MSNTARGPGGAPDDRERASWASETLSVAVRRELLQRELRKLGFRKAATDGAAPHAGSSGQQQFQSNGSSHPRADPDADSHSE